MKYIELTRGQRAIVDDEDYEFLMQWKWSVNIAKTRSGKICYAVRQMRHETLKNKRGFKKQIYIAMHRVIMKAPKGRHVDHINGNRLDNRKCNLRLCSNAENIRNQRRKPTVTSPYKGVHAVSHPYKKYKDGEDKWGYYAIIAYNGKKIQLGWFHNPKRAAETYDQIASIVHGEFACLNFPQ
ncbi:hypothetical protein LCGC14_2692660 [marine sediment metagenome]|uniref:AP2/ERF domain-containing protein n=1 Tax=marine sediment metagenome TaxID=412755 RepID=A0A0F9BSQ2_9ZZZZ|nr:HNH endonuclease [bacterium]